MCVIAHLTNLMSFAGKHSISVIYDDQEIADSPFFPEVQPPKVVVYHLQSIVTLGRKHQFWGK